MRESKVFFESFVGSEKFCYVCGNKNFLLFLKDYEMIFQFDDEKHKEFFHFFVKKTKKITLKNTFKGV